MMIRVLDVIFSLTSLLLLIPIWPLIVLVLRFTGEGEIFFVQERVGFNGKIIGVLKFATMLKDSPNIGSGNLTLPQDPRVLPVGRVLRATKVNELPQLINVLKGDLSLIGPRPRTPDQVDDIPEHLRDIFFSLRPGLSGIGSVIFRNEEGLLKTAADPTRFHSKIIAPYKAELEVWYAKNRSMRLYLSMIILTIYVVATARPGVAFRIFDLPTPPSELTSFIFD